jgi:hypothetical protein
VRQEHSWPQLCHFFTESDVLGIPSCKICLAIFILSFCSVTDMSVDTTLNDRCICNSNFYLCLSWGYIIGEG